MTISGNDIATKILGHFGIDARYVTEVVITLRANEAAKIYVEFVIPEENNIVHSLADYTIVRNNHEATPEG